MLIIYSKINPIHPTIHYYKKSKETIITQPIKIKIILLTKPVKVFWKLISVIMIIKNAFAINVIVDVIYVNYMLSNQILKNLLHIKLTSKDPKVFWIIESLLNNMIAAYLKSKWILLIPFLLEIKIQML